MNVLITGHSRGIGAALAGAYLERGDAVYGVARSRLVSTSEKLVQASADFASPESLTRILEALLPDDRDLDLVYLNAGVLGPIDAVSNVSLDRLREVMAINVWANKVILDWLVNRRHAPAQIILMSSGAAVSGNFGWGAYALSKAALNMLAQVYAHELPRSHLSALAPGLVDTAMQAAIREESAEAFPSLRRLHAAQGTSAMPQPALAAERIIALTGALKRHPSGSFVDIREVAGAQPE